MILVVQSLSFSLIVQLFVLQFVGRRCMVSFSFSSFEQPLLSLLFAVSFRSPLQPASSIRYIATAD